MSLEATLAWRDPGATPTEMHTQIRAQKQGLCPLCRQDVTKTGSQSAVIVNPAHQLSVGKFNCSLLSHYSR